MADIQSYKLYISVTVYPIVLIPTPNHIVSSCIEDDLSPCNTNFLPNCSHLCFFVNIQEGGHSILQTVYLSNYLSNRSHFNTKPNYNDVDLSPGNSHFLLNSCFLVFFAKIQNGGHSVLQAEYFRNCLSDSSHSNTEPHCIDDDLSARNTQFLPNCRHLCFFVDIQDGGHSILQDVYLRNY